jgi:hypothetical protein
VGLEPSSVATPRHARDAARGNSAEFTPNVNKADYDTIATGKWISVLKEVTELQDGTVFVPGQEAGDVIIRARAKKVVGQNLFIALRRDEERPPKRGYSAWFGGGNWFGIYKFGEGPNDLVQWRASTSFDDYFEFAFSAVGEMLTVYADGKRIGEVRHSDFRLGSLSIGAKSGRSLFQNVEIMILDKPVPTTNRMGRVRLFNGKDLTGWKSLKNGSSWTVENGVLEGQGGGAGCPAVLLSGRHDFTNFRLHAKVRYPVDSHGWIEVRRSATPRGSNGYFVYHGVWPTPTAWTHPFGSVAKATDYSYGAHLHFQVEAEPTSFGTNKWYTIEIVLNKNILTTSVDGKKLSDYIDGDESYSFGAIALVCRGDDGPVQFQEITIQGLPD